MAFATSGRRDWRFNKVSRAEAPSACAIVLLAASVLHGHDARPPAVPLPDEPDSVAIEEGLLLLTDSGPVRLLLSLEVDGRSHGARWLEFVLGLFSQLDADGDGVLAGDELNAIPTPDLLVEGNATGSTQDAAQARAELDRDPADRQVTRLEFADYMRRLGSRSMLLQQAQAGGTWMAAYGTATTNNAPLLFQRLDADGDGRLSRVELARAEQTLARYDFDGDGTFSLAELQPMRNAFAVSAAPLAVGTDATVRNGRILDMSQNPSRTARELLDRYDRATAANDQQPRAPSGAAGNDRLDAEELRIPREVFDQLDANGDGELDFDELLKMASSALPTVRLAVRIGLLRPGQAHVELLDHPAGSGIAARRTSAGTIELTWPGGELEIAAAGPMGRPPLRDILVGQLRAADADNNGYLERNEARRSPFGQIFDALDADGDGKVFAAELMSYAQRREASAAGRVAASVSDQGRNLFAILDRNRDGRVGRSELRAALDMLGEWDADRDGQIAPDEIIHRMSITFAAAQPQMPGLYQFVASPPPRQGALPGPGGEPGWFRRMDLNHDGEITRREFPGPRAAFEKLDLNGDGLIDAAEAQRGNRP